MNFKFKIFFLVLMLSSVVIAYPQLTPEDQRIQHELTTAINLDPTNPDLRFELAMEYAATGWVELGWEQLALVPKLHPDYKTIAYQKYSAIIQQDTNNWKAYFRLAFALYFHDRKDDAIDAFKDVLKLYPKHVWSMGYIALIYGEQKEYAKCIRWSQKALKINNDAKAIHFLLGKAYLEKNNYFGMLGESLQVIRLESIERKYKPTPPIGIPQ